MPIKIQAIRERRQDWVGTGQEQLKNAQKAFIQSALSQLQRYPPPNSDYVRTGNLGRSWQGRATPEGAAVENRVPYSIWVQGPIGRGQTRVMAGKGWTSTTTAAKVAEKAAADAANSTGMKSKLFAKV